VAWYMEAHYKLSACTEEAADRQAFEIPTPRGTEFVRYEVYEIPEDEPHDEEQDAPERP
jgi:hypothetical protein